MRLRAVALMYSKAVLRIDGVLFLHETMTAKKTLGVGVVLLGAAIILLREKLNHTKKAEV